MELKKAGVIAAATASLVAGTLAFPGAAMAAKGGNSNTSTAPSIALNAPEGLRVANWQPARGSQVDFSTVFPKTSKNPRVQVICYQGATMVYAEAGPVDWMFTLGGSGTTWQANGGEASCRADLFDLWWSGKNPQEVTMYASTAFNALG